MPPSPKPTPPSTTRSRSSPPRASSPPSPPTSTARAGADGASLRREPRVAALVEDVQRQRALQQDDVVKLAERELRAELRARLRLQRQQLELPDLVRERLAGPHDVPIDFVLDVEFGLWRVVEEVVDGLLPRPTLRVHSG